MWAVLLSFGIPNELIWNLTLREAEAVVDRHMEIDRAATLRAGLVAAAVYNVHRRRGDAIWSATDFVRQPLREEDFMSVEASKSMLDRWAKGVNADYANQYPEEPSP